MADIGTNQANWFPPARAQTPSRCHTAHRRGRGGEAYVVRAAFRHDSTEADELPLVCMGLWQVESRIRVRAVAACLAQDAQVLSHGSSLGASVAKHQSLARPRPLIRPGIFRSVEPFRPSPNFFARVDRRFA